MGQHGVTIGERQPEVLAAATSLTDLRPLDPGGEVGGTGDVATRHAGTEELGRRDPAPDDIGLEAAPDRLDLGKLRHTGNPTSVR